MADRDQSFPRDPHRPDRGPTEPILSTRDQQNHAEAQQARVAAVRDVLSNDPVISGRGQRPVGGRYQEQRVREERAGREADARRHERQR